MIEKPQSEFERHAAEPAGANLVTDVWFFLLHNKKWWLAPVLVLLLLFGLLMLLSGTAAGPFLYTFF